MPYIDRRRRRDLRSYFADQPQNPGELNFVITDAIQGYLTQVGLSYQTINDVLGALDGAAKEFYRRVAAPYEDKKIAENGDVT